MMPTDPNRPTAHCYKGLAYVHSDIGPDDPATLNVAWTYNWGVNGTGDRHVPMYRDPDAPSWLSLPKDYPGWILLFNEPDMYEPYGHPVSPAYAYKKWKEAKSYHPKATLVVGGCTLRGIEWFREFKKICLANKSGPAFYHHHAYLEIGYTPAQVASMIDAIHAIMDCNLWVTEYGSDVGSVTDVKTLTEWFPKRQWIQRFAYFTNRLSGAEAWCPPGWEKTMPLLDYNTGQPTMMGLYYAGAPWVS